MTNQIVQTQTATNLHRWKQRMQQQLGNTELARKLWLERVKPEQVKLDRWSCGTQACFGGHLATWPEFQAMGVRTDCYGAPRMGDLSPLDVAEALFGDLSLFGGQGFAEMRLTHYETVVKRLEVQAANLRRKLVIVGCDVGMAGRPDDEARYEHALQLHVLAAS